ncbi:unnamed protein product [Vitrella brassicaformis CCMP3155]|uniref:Lengsin n=2 Tax=Vitrella brassicaformis TaxID=1169539 RepID=A0A0G4EGR6_VITBC|nr:unnamed protein product [Vitrella brassicaformis CCMP3155]|mmetsp:Transcript_33800/g.97478  ORF Transcript_33800/g.97478 Transcript_33800/m.97478 type:complete len:465 (-) Transcript_33800:511-1905(-)|eukprot:CEL95654.1 unnamed protein product [Vitrella brassicaformis CCMP3155]
MLPPACNGAAESAPPPISRIELTKMLNQIQTEGIDFVRFEFADLHGISRSKTIPVSHVPDYGSHGLNFILAVFGMDPLGNVATHGKDTGTMEDIGYSDGTWFPDTSTFRVVPHSDRTGRVLIDPYHFDVSPSGGYMPWLMAPRSVARKQLDRLRGIGIELLTSFEYEFYLVDRATRKPPFGGINIFSTIRLAQEEKLVYEVLRSMKKMGVECTTANVEYGPGQMELTFAPSFGLEAADNAFTFKTGVKEICQRAGYMASFMTKPYPDCGGCGCHLNQSLWDVSRSVNLTGDSKEPTGFSQTAQHYMAGILHHGRAICAFFNPTTNCSKRLKENTFAPVSLSWGRQNRTCAIRGKPGHNAYFENRIGAGASNPYLILAASIAAGMDGIEKKMELPPGVNGDAYEMKDHPRLPSSLEEALAALKQNKVLCKALGEDFIKLFVAVKEWEIEHNSGDDWEMKTYFEML